jgi:predicted chitinase
MNIADVPAFLQTFEGAIQSATAFWETNNLNQFADSWNIQKLSIKINGGELGLPERIAQCNHALQVLNT